MNQEQHEQWAESVRGLLRRRCGWLFFCSVVMGSLLGYSSLFIDSLTERRWGYSSVVNDMLALMVGGGVGLLSSPFIIACLRRKRLSLALPVVYGVTFLVVASVSLVGDALLAAVPSAVTLCVMCLVGIRLFPTAVHRVDRGQCLNCGYDLRATEADLCPECGWRLGELGGPLLRTDAQKRALGLTVGLLLVGVATIRYLLPHFSYARYEAIELGMTEAEVRSVLGRPDGQQVDSNTGQLTLRWRGSGFMPIDHTVTLVDDRVVQKSTDQW